MTPAEIAVTAGDGVTLSITSDRALDFHLHGYDLGLCWLPPLSLAPGSGQGSSCRTSIIVVQTAQPWDRHDRDP